MTAAASARKTTSFWAIMVTILLLCAAMYGYMVIVMRTVPKTAENSKAGAFAALVQDLQSPIGTPATADQAAAVAAIDARFEHFVPKGGLRLGNLEGWQIQSWSESSIDGRPILKLNLRNTEGETILLALFALAKRHFPKTGGFAHKDAWFFTYGKDHDVAHIPAHQKEVKDLKDKGLNLVVTNYGNDYFLLMLSSMDSQGLAHKLFSLTTIFQSAP